MHIGIVGSGPSAIYAIQRLLTSGTPLDITVFEAGQRAGVGTPYDPGTTPLYMLANIASVEVPRVAETLHDYLSRCDDALLKTIGVERSEMTERTFHPRVALGAYYAAQLSSLCDIAAVQGHQVTVLTSCRVTDIAPDGRGVRIISERETSGVTRQWFDKIILATGHTVPVTRRFSPPTFDKPVSRGQSFGVLGSSLSAIDIAMSLAMERGAFENADYHLNAEQSPFTITMMSRAGRLPEADFYCPLPAMPLPGFGEEDVQAIVERSEKGQILDAVFMQFARLLAAEDPSYAARINLARLTADTFAQAYFAPRDTQHPLQWASTNLAETLQNAAGKLTVPWRYTILRCHEAFSTCLKALDHDELERFDRGLKKVFIDNYAAVPPRSIERLLALHRAGVFDIVKLGKDYRLDVDDSDGRVTITTGSSAIMVDAMFDGRGQAGADDDDFPFPTLRFLLKSNQDLRADARESSAIQVDDEYRLAGGLNPLRNIWCLSLPFLLDRQPFIQGLTSAAKLGHAAADDILADGNACSAEPDISLGDLAAVVHGSAPVFVNGNLVILTQKSA